MTDQTKAGDSRNEKETDGVQHDITGKLNTGKLNFSHYFLFFLIILVLIA